MFNKIQLTVFTLLFFCLLCGYFPDPLRFKRFPLTPNFHCVKRKDFLLLIERFMTKGKSHSACVPRAICVRQNYKLAPRELGGICDSFTATKCIYYFSLLVF